MPSSSISTMASNVIEVFIETLHGTAFELLVSPADTVVSIKSRISRLEGIPVSQQHLIWQCQELPDDSSLHDCNITDGATLKLVLGMRGGPIITRKGAYIWELHSVEFCHFSADILTGRLKKLLLVACRNLVWKTKSLIDGAC